MNVKDRALKKSHVFKITDNKNIGKLSSKYELLLLGQDYSSSDPSQTLTLPFSIPRPFHNPLYVLHWFPYFVLPYSTKHHHKYWVSQTIWQAKPIKFIIKLFTDHHALWVRHANHQKTKSLRAAFLSKLDNSVNNNSIFNTKYDELFTKW